jgi:hypothetical protein
MRSLLLLSLFIALFGAFSLASPTASVVLVAVAAPASLSLAAKVMAISVAIYPVLQLVKKFFPLLSGKYALAANIVLAVVGFVVSVKPEQLFTPETAFALIATVGTAAGIHGTVKNLAS